MPNLFEQSIRKALANEFITQVDKPRLFTNGSDVKPGGRLSLLRNAFVDIRAFFHRLEERK
ncbi:hypothetical protein GCM10023156_08930 [Novipirellula rosea]|uniref:Uncharacterized protein n=1 Tax=Novipirellula rosea TaxID=1031540 RepID=A0ABP8MDR7_9BACT